MLIYGRLKSRTRSKEKLEHGSWSKRFDGKIKSNTDDDQEMAGCELNDGNTRRNANTKTCNTTSTYVKVIILREASSKNCDGWRVGCSV